MDTKNIYVVIGLGYGDEGKGSVTDFLTEKLKAGFVVRYNGGPQAAHHVIRPHGNVHCFAQFGSGTFNPRVGTYLSQQMYVDPLALAAEADALTACGYPDARYRLYIDSMCPLVTIYHKFLKRLKEAMRGANRHSSTGMGVGEAALSPHKIRVQDIADNQNVIIKLFKQKQECLRYIDSLDQTNKEADEILSWFEKQSDPFKHLKKWHEDWKPQIKTSGQMGAILQDHTNATILESAQGVLLDPVYGFQPYVTKTDSTGKNAAMITERFFERKTIKRIGVTRCYSTRHGNGPLPAECGELLTIEEIYNKENQWQGAFRKGWLDVVALRYAVEISNVDGLFITCVDQMYGRKFCVCESYLYHGDYTNVDMEKFFEIEMKLLEKLYINRIKTLKEGSKERTQILQDCKPGIMRRFGNIAQIPELYKFFEYLQEATGVPVIGYSEGPERSAKFLCSAFPG